MQTQLRTRLLNNATVSGIVGTRIDWGARPQGDPYPSLVLTLVNDERPQSFSGNISSRATIVQIDCYGVSVAQVATLREAVISAIVPSATVGGIIFDRAFIQTVRNMSSISDTGIVYRDSIDCQVWHRS